MRSWARGRSAALGAAGLGGWLWLLAGTAAAAGPAAGASASEAAPKDGGEGIARLEEPPLVDVSNPIPDSAPDAGPVGDTSGATTLEPPVLAPSADGPRAADDAPEAGEVGEDEGELDPGSVQVGGKSVGDVDDIEDLGLEGLLDMDLGEQLGKTEAASAKQEDVLRAPATLTTLDAEEIRLSGAVSIPDLLRRVPGLQVTRGASGNDVVAIRGTGGLANNNLVVLVDGTPIASPLDGSIDWDLVPLNVADIERLEVVRGPVSPVYGANAYTGVVNIVTREAIGITPSWQARAIGGVDLDAAPYGAASASVVHVGERVSGKWMLNAAYDDLYNDIPDAPGRHPPNLRVGTIGSIDAQFGKRGYVHGQIGGSFSQRTGMDLLVRESNPTQRYLGLMSLAVGWRDLPSFVDSVEIWARDRAHFVRTDEDDYVGLNYAGTNSNRTELGVDAAFDVHRIFELHAGVAGVLDWIDAPYINESARGLHAGFAYHAGGRLAPTKTFDLTADFRGDAAPSMGRLIHSGRISAVYHREMWALRFTGGSAFRALTYVEGAGRFIDPQTGFILLEGDPNLREPLNHNVEIGAIVSPVTGLTIAPTVYFGTIGNPVITNFEPLPQKSFATDEVQRLVGGYELELRWRQSDALVLSAAMGRHYFLRVDEDVIPTIGVPEQNSKLTASLRAYGVALNERLGYGVGGRVATPRTYRANAGIPLQIVDVEVPTTADIDGMIEYHLPDRFPMWLSLRARTFLMPNVVEAPFNNAAPRGTSFLLGLEYRGR